MSKIVNIYQMMSIECSHGKGNCNNWSDGYSCSALYDYSAPDMDHNNGFTKSTGVSQGTGNSYRTSASLITSAADPVGLTPLRFRPNASTLEWDEAWDRATEEEKQVLILWMQLK